MANAHSRFHPGKRVRIKLKNGRVIFGRFKDWHSQRTELADGTMIAHEQIVSLSILKTQPEKKGIK